MFSSAEPTKQQSQRVLFLQYQEDNIGKWHECKTQYLLCPAATMIIATLLSEACNGFSTHLANISNFRQYSWPIQTTANNPLLRIMWNAFGLQNSYSSGNMETEAKLFFPYFHISIFHISIFLHHWVKKSSVYFGSMIISLSSKVSENLHSCKYWTKFMNLDLIF